MTDTAVRETVDTLFRRIREGADATEIARLFSEDVDWFIAGDTATVPWIGRKSGRHGVAEFFRQLREHVAPERFAIDAILVGQARAVVLGDLATRVKRTGRLIETAFAFDIGVRDGLIVRYHMLEDSWAVAEATR